jgi:glycosyltransferase involved in cell wall biosynthesis
VILEVMGSDVLLLHQCPRKRQATLEGLHKADAVVAVSRDLADRLLEYGVPTEKLHLVYRGVDSTLFRPGARSEARCRLGLPQDTPLLLFVGNLFPVKGLDVLLEACAQLASGGLAFQCLLVGAGPLRPHLEAQARTLGLQGRVRFVGPVANNRLPDWYRAATAVVLPSRSEGVPNVLLEATACGVPYVASRVGGIPEIAHYGVNRLVPPGDAGQLAGALAAFLKGEVAGTGAVPARSWDESAAELIGVFEKALWKRRHGAVADTVPAVRVG